MTGNAWFCVTLVNDHCLKIAQCAQKVIANPAKPRRSRLRGQAALKIQNRQAVALSGSAVCVRIFILAAVM